MRLITFCLFLAPLVFVFSNEASAHGLDMYVTQKDAGSVSGRVTYDDDAPLARTEVRVLSESGDTLTSVKTASNGTFTLPIFDETITIEVSTPDGHRITQKIEYEDLGGDGDSQESGTSITNEDMAFLTQKIVGLEEQIYAYENRVRLHEIIGGIGYIVGVMGLIALLKRPKSS